MKLHEFRQLTDGLPAETELHILLPWGESVPATLISREDLVEGDPALDSFPESGLVFDEEAS